MQSSRAIGTENKPGRQPRLQDNPMRLTPPADCREEISFRLHLIDKHRHLNAIYGVNPDALKQAEHYQALRQSGTLVGPLHGVPLIVKDNIACAGLPITLGCIGLASVKATQDALVIRRLRQAGAIVLAREGMSEFAFDVRSRSSLGGDVRNPLRPTLTAGGSSGGCAAAVAAGMADGAIGTDTGGSIRIPCSYTGLVGLRPAFRRSQLAGVAPLSLSKDTVGPMVHSVQDAVLLHAIMHDKSPSACVAASLKGRRFGRVNGLEGDDPQQLAVWHYATDRLRQAGIEIVDISLPVLDETEQSLCLSLYEFQVGIDHWMKQHPGAPAGLQALIASAQFLPEFAPLLEQMSQYQHLKIPAWLAGRRFQRRLRQILCTTAEQHRLDSFIYPTVRRLPESLEKMPPGCAPELAAISGLPAITLPCGMTQQGLPVGLEMLSIETDETTLLSLAMATEQLFCRE